MMGECLDTFKESINDLSSNTVAFNLYFLRN